MPTKNKAYVVNQNEVSNLMEAIPQSLCLSLEEQIELFSEIIIDAIINDFYENKRPA